MATATSSDRGQWSGKLGFIIAAAGSAVGLGNIWRYPSEVADNGGAAFIVVYLICCFMIGFPVMVAELAIGRRTKRNPVGAFKALSDKKVYSLIGMWGVLCGVMILSYYLVIAGWAFGFVFSEFVYFTGNTDLVNLLADLGNGTKSAFFSLLFIIATIFIVTGGVSGGIERAAKLMMPMLIVILLILIGYVLTQEGSGEGLRVYLTPDFSKINAPLLLRAMGQAFFSLSLGMGALITYGSYLDKKQNIAEAAAYVTLADVGMACLAGLLIIPAMYVAQNNGIQIFNPDETLINTTGLIFNVLPALFHTMAPGAQIFFGLSFFLLLSMAALTSTISLLEVPVSYAIDEHGLSRKKAAWGIGLAIGVLAVGISYSTNLIGIIDTIFSTIGLPLGGLLICLFLGYVWKTGNALLEIQDGFPGVESHWFGKAWPIFVRYICPILIGIVFVTTIYNML